MIVVEVRKGKETEMQGMSRGKKDCMTLKNGRKLEVIVKSYSSENGKSRDALDAGRFISWFLDRITDRLCPKWTKNFARDNFPLITF
jgi:hypothetical protein